MSLPLEDIPLVLEHCCSTKKEVVEQDGVKMQVGAIFKAQMKLLASQLRAGAYGPAELQTVRKILTTPPIDEPWSQEKWDVLREEFNEAVDMVDGQ